MADYAKGFSVNHLRLRLREKCGARLAPGGICFRMMREGPHQMKLQKIIVINVIGMLLVWGLLSCRARVVHTEASPVAAAPTVAPAAPLRTAIGFRSRRQLEEHYEKHGREFGAISQAEYLRQAQTLRDSPAGGDILEAVRSDGVTTRFDRQSGAFLAFNDDFTIRTFFRPNDGERYFKRQLNRKS